MKRALYQAILLLLVAAVHGQQPPSSAQTDIKEIHLKAIVKTLIPLVEFSGEATGEADEGKTYDFSLRRKVEGGKVRFSELRLVQKTGQL